MELKAIVWKEEDMYVIKEVITGVTTQGSTRKEAISNLKEALELYLEEMPEMKEMLQKTKIEGFVDVKVAEIIG